MNTKVFAARVKDSEVLMRSSSGGMFTALSDAIFRENGAVACAVYDYEEHRTVFRLITSAAERDAARGSKYMQAYPGNIFCECEYWLQSNPGRNILFVGTGCQADGFRRFTEKKGFSGRVYTVDIICHGVPSPLIWDEYAKYIEEKYGGRIEFLSFKDKRKNWHYPTPLVKMNGKEHYIRDYVKIFYSQCALRPSCHVCPYASMSRSVDMTIGDYWHIEEKMPDFYSPDGNSLVLIYTERGMQLFDMLKADIDYEESDTESCWQNNLEKPTPVSPRREQFWRDHEEKGIAYILNEYGRIPEKQIIKDKLAVALRSLQKR